VSTKSPANSGSKTPPHGVLENRETGIRLKSQAVLFRASHHSASLERDYIIAELAKNRVIADVISYPAADHLSAERVNRYITDGRVTLASLA
jgi:hypothetical protein